MLVKILEHDMFNVLCVMCNQTISVLTVRVTGELAPKGESDFVKSAAQEEDRTFEIAYVAAASPLLVSDRFLMPRAHV